MAIIDSMKDKMGDMSEEMKARMSMLKSQEKDGTLTEEGKAELERLRARMPGNH